MENQLSATHDHAQRKRKASQCSVVIRCSIDEEHVTVSRDAISRSELVANLPAADMLDCVSAPFDRYAVAAWRTFAEEEAVEEVKFADCVAALQVLLLVSSVITSG